MPFSYYVLKILIDGVDIQYLDETWLRSNIGMVIQEPILFNTTIRENILLGNPKATEEEIVTSAINANAHSFIKDLPEGYDTYVGEGGIQLSGGQKQRIAIARALIRNPKILLLDEATSALDTHSEKVIQETMNRTSKQRTTVIVAHRLTTVQNADIILCIEEGKVVEVGNHNELMKKGGLYSELVDTQFKHAQNGKTMLICIHMYLLKVSSLSDGSTFKVKAPRSQSVDRGKHRKKSRVITRSLSSTSVNWTEYTPLVQVRFYLLCYG